MNDQYHGLPNVQEHSAGQSPGSSMAPPQGVAPRRRRRWWLYALGVVGGLFMVALALVIALVVYWNSLIRNYTATEPQPIPVAETNPGDVQALKERFEQFKNTVGFQRTTPPLSVTADELNLLVAQNKDLKGRLFLEIADNRLIGKFSVPLNATRKKELQGRHLNGTLELSVSLENGFFTAKVLSVELNGRPIPRWIFNRIKDKNLMDKVNNDRETLDILQSLEDIRIEDGKITFIPHNP